MNKLILVILACAGLSGADMIATPCAQARWPSLTDNSIPLWVGACPKSYAAWRYDKRRNPVCVQNI